MTFLPLANCELALLDEEPQVWRDDRGRKAPSPALAEDVPVRMTKVVLAAAHLDHDPAHCGRKRRNVDQPNS